MRDYFHLPYFCFHKLALAGAGAGGFFAATTRTFKTRKVTHGDTTKTLINRTHALANDNSTDTRARPLNRACNGRSVSVRKTVFCVALRIECLVKVMLVPKTHVRKLAYTYTPCARFPSACLTSSSGIAIEICRITRDILNKLNPINRHFRVPIGNIVSNET